MNNENAVFHIGDIFWADLPDNNGSVQKGVRPVVCLGSNIANRYSPTITVLPLSSKVDKGKRIPTHVLTNALAKTSIILPEQITTIQKSRILGQRIGLLSAAELESTIHALQYQLGFRDA